MPNGLIVMPWGVNNEHQAQETWEAIKKKNIDADQFAPTGIDEESGAQTVSDI